MPAKPQWLLRVPEILEQLSDLKTPVIDRSGIEQLFGLKRRQAISCSTVLVVTNQAKPSWWIGGP